MSDADDRAGKADCGCCEPGTCRTVRVDIERWGDWTPTEAVSPDLEADVTVAIDGPGRSAHVQVNLGPVLAGASETEIGVFHFGVVKPPMLELLDGDHRHTAWRWRRDLQRWWWQVLRLDLPPDPFL